MLVGISLQNGLIITLNYMALFVFQYLHISHLKIVQIVVKLLKNHYQLELINVRIVGILLIETITQQRTFWHLD